STTRAPTPSVPTASARWRRCSSAATSWAGSAARRPRWTWPGSRPSIRARTSTRCASTAPAGRPSISTRRRARDPGRPPCTWLSLVDHLAIPAAREFRPDLVLVSAGYDAHRDDPLADCQLLTSSYGALATRVRRLGDELGVPVGAVMEGGYDLAALASSVIATMEAFADGAEPKPVEPDELTRAAAEQVGRYWKVSA